MLKVRVKDIEGKEAQPMALPKEDLIDSTYNQVGLSETTSTQPAEYLLEIIEETLESGKDMWESEFQKRVFSGSTSFQVNVTRFESQKGRTFIAGYVKVNETMKVPSPEMQLIKEDGQWKFYGNQKENQI